MRTRPDAAGFESAALLLTPYWGRRRVEESYGGGGSGRTCSLGLLTSPPPCNLSSSTGSLKLRTLFECFGSRVPASHLTGLVSTSEGCRSQRRGASGTAQSSKGRRGRPEPLPGGSAPEEAEEPPRCGWRELLTPPLPLSPVPARATAPAAEAAAAALLSSPALLQSSFCS